MLSGGVALTGTIAVARPGIRPQGPYWPSLDGIRGVSMLLVFVFHVWPPAVPGASVCVDSFFVLSAFLITTLLVREHERTGRIRLGRFYARRALRLLPVLFLVAPTAAAVAYTALPEMRGEVWPALRSTLLYFANFRAANDPTGMAVFLPTWSLSTEEQFYVAWPILLVAMLALRWSPRRILLVSTGLLVASVVWLQAAYETGTSLSALYFRPDLRVTGIIVGTTIGILYSYRLLPDWERLRPPITVAAVLGAVYVAAFIAHPQFVPGRFEATLAIVAACVGWAAIILRQVHQPFGPMAVLLENRPMVWVGRASYTIYLLHVPVIRTTRDLLGHPRPIVTGLVAAAVTLALTVVVHYLVERPALRLKDRRLEPPAGDGGAPRLRSWPIPGRRSTLTSSSES